MKKGIYVYRDVLSGQYEFFGTFVNDAVAARQFKASCNDAGVPASDLELYCASRIDTTTGRIYHVEEDVPISDAPKFIVKGEKNVSNNV